MKLPDGDYELKGIEIVGYHDLDGRPGFKMALREDAGQWFLYLGRLWHPGWTILDVTDPTEPVLVRSIEGPANTWTIQVQVAGHTMITSLEKIDAGWGDDPDAPFEEGFLVWELADPAAPTVVGRFQTGGNGTHRNFYDGGPLVHLAAAAAGFEGHIYQIVDIANPAAPRSVGRWWIPGQWRAGGEPGVPEGTSLHAPFVVGDRAYLAYGAGGLVILDISDRSRPRSVGRLDFAPPFNPVIAVHTAVPFPERGLVAVNSEAIEEDCDEPLGFAGLVDITNESAPRVISMFPVPAPSPEAPYRNFCEHGGRFGPHNLHQAQGQSALENRSDRVYLTYFNAGLRVIDVSDPRLPREVASFVPPDPVERRGILPRTLVAQTEDVLVDARGFVYVTDKNHGVHILRVYAR
jgi:hypothetical protein